MRRVCCGIGRSDCHAQADCCDAGTGSQGCLEKPSPRGPPAVKSSHSEGPKLRSELPRCVNGLPRLRIHGVAAYHSRRGQSQVLREHRKAAIGALVRLLPKFTPGCPSDQHLWYSVVAQ